MATELVTMGTDMLKVIRKYQQTSTGSSKSWITALQLCAHNVFYEGALSLRYRLTNGHFDDVHLQLIIEIVRELKADLRPDWEKIWNKLIPSLMSSQGSLLTPQKTLNSGLRCNTFISGWAWYLRFQPDARTISTLKIGVEIKSRALEWPASSH